MSGKLPGTLRKPRNIPDPHGALIAAVLWRAVRDVKKAEPVVADEALEWLRDTGRDYARYLGIDAGLERWLAKVRR